MLGCQRVVISTKHKVADADGSTVSFHLNDQRIVLYKFILTVNVWSKY